MPVARLENGSWPHPSRLPLGGGWCGQCTAPGHEGETPAGEVLEAFCKLWYASGCAWSPSERRWDAVRFAVSAPRDVEVTQTAGNAAELPTLVLRYVCEKDHRPADDGELEFDVSRAVWLRRHNDARIQKMAECFLESFLTKRA